MSDDPAPEPASESATDLAVRVHSVAQHLLRRRRREDEALGISAARLSALAVVGFGGPRTLGELAAAEQVAPPTMTRIVSALARAGLVVREGGAAAGRVVLVRATAQGRLLLEEGCVRRVARLADQLQTLSVAELELLTEATALLEGVLERLI
jgi:DNA-binding MarR family transcriptional regulator